MVVAAPRPHILGETWQPNTTTHNQPWEAPVFHPKVCWRWWPCKPPNDRHSLGPITNTPPPAPPLSVTTGWPCSSPQVTQHSQTHSPPQRQDTDTLTTTTPKLHSHLTSHLRHHICLPSGTFVRQGVMSTFKNHYKGLDSLCFIPSVKSIGRESRFRWVFCASLLSFLHLYFSRQTTCGEGGTSRGHEICAFNSTRSPIGRSPSGSPPGATRPVLALLRKVFKGVSGAAHNTIWRLEVPGRGGCTTLLEGRKYLSYLTDIRDCMCTSYLLWYSIL